MNFSKSHLIKIILLPFAAVTIAFSSASSAQAESWGLLLYKEGTGQGRVCVAYDANNECQVDDAGTETNIELNEHIRLRATPEPGSHFVQWVGDCRGRSAVCEMLTQKPRNNKPLTATAIFAQGPAKPIKPAPVVKAPVRNKGSSTAKVVDSTSTKVVKSPKLLRKKKKKSKKPKPKPEPE